MENIVFTQLSITEVRKLVREEMESVISGHLEKPEKNVNSDLLTIQQVAEYINLAVTSVYGLVHRREIPFIKRGKKLRFERGEITQWLQGGRQKTKQQINKEAESYISGRET